MPLHRNCLEKTPNLRLFTRKSGLLPIWEAARFWTVKVSLEVAAELRDEADGHDQ